MDQRHHARKDSGAELILAGRKYDVEDLSQRGLRVIAEAPMPVGQKVPFFLRLPGGNTIHGMAEVRWAEATGWRRAHGLEFVKIGRLQRRSLFKHLNPRHFGIIEALDLTLEFACCLALFLSAREFLQDPFWMRVFTDVMPWACMASGIGLTGYFLKEA